MSTQTSDLIDTGNAVAAEKPVEESKLDAADTGGQLRTTSRLPGEDSAVSRSQAAKNSGQYVHDNHWNWH